MKKLAQNFSKVNPNGEIVSNGRSHVEGASENRNKDENQLKKSNGVEPQKTVRK